MLLAIKPGSTLQVDVFGSFQAQLRWESEVPAPSPGTAAEPAREMLSPLTEQ